MKVLIYVNNKAEEEYFRNLFTANFPKINLFTSTNRDSLINNITYESPFAAVIIDCEIKDDNPSELATEIIDFVGERPLLFLGKETFIRDRISQEVFTRSHLNEILPRPVDHVDFKMKMEKIIEWQNEQNLQNALVEDDVSNFLGFKIKYFHFFDQFDHDVYTAYTQTQFLKVINKKEKYPFSIIADLQRKKVKQLYVLKDDQIRFLENSIAKNIKTLKQDRLSEEKIFHQQVIGCAVMQTFINQLGITELVKEYVEVLIDSILDKCEKHHFNTFEILKMLPKQYIGIPSKSITTAYLCVGITERMKWTSSQSNRKLILAALLHDIALDTDVLAHIQYKHDEDLEILDEREKELFFEHMNKAAILSHSFNRYSDVDFIIREHHEHPGGDGFPGVATAQKLSVISCVFILSQYFASKLYDITLTKENLEQIFFVMHKDFNQGSFREPFKACKDLFKLMKE